MAFQSKGPRLCWVCDRSILMLVVVFATIQQKFYTAPDNYLKCVLKNKHKKKQPRIKSYFFSPLSYYSLSHFVACLLQLPSHHTVLPSAASQCALRLALFCCGGTLQLQQNVLGALRSSELREAVPGAAGPPRRFHSQHQIQGASTRHHSECEP